MRVLLPAPFSPINARTSPWLSVSDTPESAMTPGKRFTIPLIASRVLDEGVTLMAKEVTHLENRCRSRFRYALGAFFTIRSQELPRQMVFRCRGLVVSSFLLGAGLAAPPADLSSFSSPR